MATTYFEIIVKGDKDLLRAFIHGFQTGRGIRGGIWLGSDHPINTSHLKEIFTFKGHHAHVICVAAVRRSIASTIAKAEDLGFEIVSSRKLRGAAFAFKFETYNLEVAERIKSHLRSLPPSLRLLDYQPEETSDRTARGVELYTPVHDYRFRGRGAIEGDFRALLEFREKLSAEEFMDLDDIELGRA